MRSLTLFLRSISTQTLTCFNSSFGDRKFLANEETENITLSQLWKIPLCCDGIQEHKNAEGGRHKGTKSTTKQDFSGKALSKQNIKAWLASLSFDSSRAPTERSAIFAFGVCDGILNCLKFSKEFSMQINYVSTQFSVTQPIRSGDLLFFNGCQVKVAYGTWQGGNLHLLLKYTYNKYKSIQSSYW